VSLVKKNRTLKELSLQGNSLSSECTSRMLRALEVGGGCSVFPHVHDCGHQRVVGSGVGQVDVGQLGVGQVDVEHVDLGHVGVGQVGVGQVGVGYTGLG
jgi:hypothetical protein